LNRSNNRAPSFARETDLYPRSRVVYRAVRLREDSVQLPRQNPAVHQPARPLRVTAACIHIYGFKQLQWSKSTNSDSPILLACKTHLGRCAPDAAPLSCSSGPPSGPGIHASPILFGFNLFAAAPRRVRNVFARPLRACKPWMTQVLKSLTWSNSTLACPGCCSGANGARALVRTTVERGSGVQGLPLFV
jgi:hypothetical protein